MEPIRSLREICFAQGLLPSQIVTLQALLERRKGVLHPYWVQIALYVPYGLAKALHDEIIANEWAIPDQIKVNGVTYETELDNSEILLLAWIELNTTR